MGHLDRPCDLTQGETLEPVRIEMRPSGCDEFLTRIVHVDNVYTCM
jgi:hypothetical protein